MEGFAIQNRGVVYVIDNVGGMPVRYSWRYSHLIGESEVVFTRVTPSQIRGAYGSRGEWIPNPSYGS